MATKASRRRPGRPARGEREPNASRVELLRAAEAVFVERGYEKASVDAILERAGLSKGTFYFSFAGKEDLFLQLLDTRLDAPVRELMELTRSSPAETPTADRVSQGLAEIFSGQRPLILLLHEYWAAAARNPHIANRFRKRQQGLRAALASALSARHERTGVPMTMPAAQLAEAFIALASGLSMDAVTEPAAVTADLFGEIASLVYDGMVYRSER